ncbi:23813_t:CDS:2 [Cetraspora pellucida]|uniref:23813_t:CDS:1 n=1 Tax=Cetraspora pellucida TaxID=1433469 RepID=A0A9N9HTI7_9GLOM|nr:23813_t:CDS:2 [Cetraspora pellucida]
MVEEIKFFYDIAYDTCYKESSKTSPYCAKVLENKSKRSFTYEPEHKRYIKRSADPLEDELSYHGLVYMPKTRKRNPQSLLKEKRTFKREETDTNAQNLESNLTSNLTSNLASNLTFNLTSNLTSNTSTTSPIVNTTFNNSTTEETEDVILKLALSLTKLRYIFRNPPPAKINPNGWPDKDVYDPALDKMFWWRNDPVLNEFHEHWHIVMMTVTDSIPRNREGENFIYTHRHLLARYDAERLCLDIEKVKALTDYVTPVPEPFYPHPYLVEDWNDEKVPFPARPANQSFHDIVEVVDGKLKTWTIVEMERLRVSVIEWIDGGTNDEYPTPLQLTDSDTAKLALDVETNLHNYGHELFSYMMHPYTIGYPPSVLVGARAGIRDPLFWRWHRHLDDLLLRWQDRFEPSDFHHDAPNVTIRQTDIILSFTDVLLKVYPTGQKDKWSEFGKKTFGGSNFDVDFLYSPIVTNEFHTKMKYREYVWREDLFTKENISYVYPREWNYFLRVTNEVNIVSMILLIIVLNERTSTITFRIFFVPEVYADSRVHWIELDKFKAILQPLEKAVIVRECDKSIIIRKPAQKTESEFDESQITPSMKKANLLLTVQAKSEKAFCNCGWPYHMILPRGTKGEGIKFKLIVFISDGTNDMVPLYDQCGSTVLCGGEKWADRIPDARPLGYPFDRPFKNGSYEKTFKGLHNAAIRDVTIIWKDDDFPEF